MVSKKSSTLVRLVSLVVSLVVVVSVLVSMAGMGRVRTVDAQEDVEESVIVVVVDSRQGWQDGPRLQKGDSYYIYFEYPKFESWTVDKTDIKKYPYVGPGGYNKETDDSDCAFQEDSPFGSMIGQFKSDNGSNDIPVYIDDERHRVPADGTLKFRINDKDTCLGDNNGEIRVRISKIPRKLDLLPNLKLPYARENRIQWTSGPHIYNSTDDMRGDFPSGLGSGLDFANGNFKVLAIAAGKVVYSSGQVNRTCGDLGCIVAIDHCYDENGREIPDCPGLVSIYAHLSEAIILEGVSVREGTNIGRAGGTANGGAVQWDVHLHLELRDGGKCTAINPKNGRSLCIEGYKYNNPKDSTMIETYDYDFGNPVGWGSDYAPTIGNYKILEYYTDKERMFARNYDGSAISSLETPVWIDDFPYTDEGSRIEATVGVSPDDEEYYRQCTSEEKPTCEKQHDGLTLFASVDTKDRLNRSGGYHIMGIVEEGNESYLISDNEPKIPQGCPPIGPCFLAAPSIALPESSVFAAPTFQNYWQANTALWGNPISDGMREPYAGKPDGVRQVQYFEKSRMEINDASQPHNVTNGLLVREMIEGRIQIGDAMYDERSPAEEAVAGDPTASNPNAPTYASFRSVSYPVNATRSANRVGQVVTEVLAKDGSVSNTADLARYGIMLGAYDEQLGHNIPTVFTSYLASHGIDQMAVAGLPLSEPYWARVNVGGVEKDVLIQVFERRVMTYTPDNPAAWQVEMGNVGQHYMTWRYSQ